MRRLTTSRFLMRYIGKLALLASTLVLASLLEAGAVLAQTKKTVQVQHGTAPYIRHKEFQNISVGREAASGKSSGSQVVFRYILTVASLDEVTRRFGEPTSTEYKKFPGVDYVDYLAIIRYKGIDLYYKKVDKRIKLRTMVITSEDRFLEVGGVRLRPGMSTDSLSAVMRKAVEEDEDGIAVMRVARPGKSKDRRSIQDSRTKISIETDKKR